MLEKMKSFIVLSETKSFTEAAQRLFCSQPTISIHIQQLEQYFDRKLLLRSGKSIELTRQGEVFLKHAKEMTALLDETVYHVKQIKDTEVLSVFMSNYIARYYFSISTFGGYENDQSSHNIEINSYCYNELKHAIISKEAKFAIMPIYMEDKEVFKQCSISYLFEDEFVLVFSPNHEWKNRKILYFRDLKNEMLLVPQSIYLRKLIIRTLTEKNIQVRYAQMGDFEMIKKLIKEEFGIGFLPYNAVSEEINKGELRTLPVSSLSLKRKNGIVVRNDANLSKKERLFCQTIKENLLVRQS